MKRGTISHPKMEALIELLGIPRYSAVGILECLWDWSRRYAIQGNVGKWPDKTIAKAIGWKGQPEKLVNALVDTGWLDRHPRERLVIHDIQKHADNTWRQCLQDSGLNWWDGSEPRSRKTQVTCQPLASHLPETCIKSPQPLKEPLNEPEPLKESAADASSLVVKSISHPAVKAYRDVFKKSPGPQQREEILKVVSDMDTWSAVLSDWATNGYNPQNITGLLSRYERETRISTITPRATQDMSLLGGLVND